MRHVVLDTNALIQALPTRSRYHRIWSDFLAGHPKTVYRESYFRFHLLSDVDKDDDKFVDCAITAGADYIVTEDSHFDRLKQIPFPQLNVLTLDEFNDTLK